MSDDVVKNSSRKEHEAKTIDFDISEGEDDEVIFTAQYDPDQMASVIECTYSRPYYINTYGAYSYLYHEPRASSRRRNQVDVVEMSKRMKIDPTPENLELLREFWAEQQVDADDGVDEIGLYKPRVTRFLDLIRTEKDHQIVREAVSAYIKKNMHVMVYQFYGMFVAEVMDHALRELARRKDKSGWETPHKDDIELLGRMTKESIKHRLNARKPGGRDRSINRSQLREVYKQYLRVWQEANSLNKFLMREEPKEESRYKRIHTTYPELPYDLIAWFGKSNPYESTPSYIAAEHAGRLCGLAADRTNKKYRKYSPNYLLRLISSGPGAQRKSRLGSKKKRNR